MSVNRSALVVVAMTGPAVAQDDVGQERRLERPRRRHHQHVLFQRDPQPVPVVGAAEEHRVLARVQDPVAQREGGADPGRPAQRGQAAPAQPQAEDVGEALAGVQPQVQPDPQVAGAVAGQVAGGQERPRGERRHDEHDGQGDGVLEHHRGSPFRAARTALRRAVRAAPGCRPAWGARAEAIRGDGARAGSRRETHAVRSPDPGSGRSWSPSPGPSSSPGPAGRRRAGAGRARRPGATGHSSSTQARNPVRVEAGARVRRSSHRARPPRTASGVGASAARVRAEVLVAGERPGADDADQGVAGQGVGDGRQRPDGQVPPAGFGGQDVHEHAGADGGQVQRAGPERAAAVQGQRDAQAGEDQCGGVRDRRFQGGDGGQVAGGVDHAVLGGEADRGGGRGQDAEPGGGVAQPQAGAVAGPPGRDVAGCRGRVG